MKNNLPDIKKEGIFTKVKKWFESLFGIGKIEEPAQQSINNNVKERKKNEFKESIRVENKDRLLALQRELETEQIEISDLTDKELDKMIELYKNKIKEKEEKVKRYKDKTTEIQRKEKYDI